MIGLRVDTPDTDRHAEEAGKDIRGRLHAVEKRLKEAAMEERLTHDYQNQTTHLQQSTAAVVVSEDDDGIEIHLEMDEEYASYVIARGYSRFEEIASEAFQDIDGILYGDE